MTFDGISLWLVPFTNPNLVKLNPENLHYAEFDMYRAGASNAFFNGCVFDGEKLWAVPRNVDYFVTFKGGEFQQDGLSTTHNLDIGGEVYFRGQPNLASIGTDADGKLIAGSGGGGNTTINTTGGAAFLEMSADANLLGAFQDIPELEFNMVAGETYEITLTLLTESVGFGATEGFRIKYDFAGGGDVGFSCTVPNGNNGILRRLTNATDIATIATVTAGTKDISVIQGVVRCTADGLFKWQIESETEATVAITVYQGSIMKINQVN